MTLDNIINKMKLTLAAAVVATSIGCKTTPEPVYVEPSASETLQCYEATMANNQRGSNETDSEYRRRMEQMHNQQAGMVWTSGGYVPQEDSSFYSGMSQSDARRYGGHR